MHADPFSASISSLRILNEQTSSKHLHSAANLVSHACQILAASTKLGVSESACYYRGKMAAQYKTEAEFSALKAYLEGLADLLHSSHFSAIKSE